MSLLCSRDVCVCTDIKLILCYKPRKIHQAWRFSTRKLFTRRFVPRSLVTMTATAEKLNAGLRRKKILFHVVDQSTVAFLIRKVPNSRFQPRIVLHHQLPGLNQVFCPPLRQSHSNASSDVPHLRPSTYKSVSGLLLENSAAIHSIETLQPLSRYWIILPSI